MYSMELVWFLNYEIDEYFRGMHLNGTELLTIICGFGFIFTEGGLQYVLGVACHSCLINTRELQAK